MSFIGKTYKLVKAENFKEFLESLNIPEERIQTILKSNPSQRLEKNGDEYTLVVIDENGTKKTSFKSGVEFQETLGEKYVSNSKIIVDGNVVTQTLDFKTEGVVMTIVREFKDNEIIAKISTNKWPGPAYRYYSA